LVGVFVLASAQVNDSSRSGEQSNVSAFGLSLPASALSVRRPRLIIEGLEKVEPNTKVSTEFNAEKFLDLIVSRIQGE